TAETDPPDTMAPSTDRAIESITMPNPTPTTGETTDIVVTVANRHVDDIIKVYFDSTITGAVEASNSFAQHCDDQNVLTTTDTLTFHAGFRVPGHHTYYAVMMECRHDEDPALSRLVVPFDFDVVSGTGPTNGPSQPHFVQAFDRPPDVVFNAADA